MPAKNQRLILLAILALAVLLRVGVALYLGDTVPTGKDEQSYSELAARLATGHGYSFDRPWYPFAPAGAPTAHWSFLFWPTADSSLIFNAGRLLSIALFLPFMLYGIWVEVKAKVEAKAEAGYFSTSALTLTFVLFYSAPRSAERTFRRAHVPQNARSAERDIATWAISRDRLPVDAVLLIFAAVEIADLTGRWAARRR